MKISIKKKMLEGSIHARSIEHFKIIEDLKRDISRQPWIKFDYKSLNRIKDKLQQDQKNSPDQDLMADNTIPKGKKCQIIEFTLNESDMMKVAVVFKREDWGISCMQLYCDDDDADTNKCTLSPIKVLLIREIEKVKDDVIGKPISEIILNSKKIHKKLPYLYLMSVPLTPSTGNSCNITNDDFQMSMFIYLVSSTALMIIKNGLAEVDDNDVYYITPYNNDRFFNAFSSFERNMQ